MLRSCSARPISRSRISASRLALQAWGHLAGGFGSAWVCRLRAIVGKAGDFREASFANLLYTTTDAVVTITAREPSIKGGSSCETTDHSASHRLDRLPFWCRICNAPWHSTVTNWACSIYF